ncbi:hypothetical protein UFOVP92_8 [uncultured Caudovirales phage]|uniref:Uncharacterized protein n=1 Tax=uncultured Caudovirales phage TaxID=2100421 RepID=A0A6J5KYF7_9CAUD|nr:hypothetical protein UFOVP92_8 [uncultured Caudovirales phage]
MRVRIKQEPSQIEECWCVETKKWHEFSWVRRDSCWGDNAQGRAMQIADQYLNPRIIECAKVNYSQASEI